MEHQFEDAGVAFTTRGPDEGLPRVLLSQVAERVSAWTTSSTPVRQGKGCSAAFACRVDRVDLTVLAHDPMRESPGDRWTASIVAWAADAPRWSVRPWWRPPRRDGLSRAEAVGRMAEVIDAVLREHPSVGHLEWATLDGLGAAELRMMRGAW